MAQTKTLGGERLGSGKKMKVELHGFERSTHDLSYLWRSTMSAGTLVPFMKYVALPGDTFDINLNCDVKTHPTTGPLFGSYKVQADIFIAPFRLYQAQLHNNELGIGMRMDDIKLPYIELYAKSGQLPSAQEDPDNYQINPSCILSYLGIRGVGNTFQMDAGTLVSRKFNAIPLLAYWEIFKNYYANKMEDYAYVIHTPVVAVIETVDDISITGFDLQNVYQNITITHDLTNMEPLVIMPSYNLNGDITINYTGATPLLEQIILRTSKGNIPMSAALITRGDTAGQITGIWNYIGRTEIYGWAYINEIGGGIVAPPRLVQFALDDSIDAMRREILAAAQSGTTPFSVNDADLMPYTALLTALGEETSYKYTQEGLAVKTYNSDLFNNWLKTEIVVDQINDITAIDTSSGSFTIDQLQLARKVYDMLNRIAVSGGSYDDWLDVIWDEDRITRSESPMYTGSLIRELVFQEVISNSASSIDETQPLGTLGGRGVMADKRKGGQFHIKIDEPAYIIGIISLTPRIDYSQGNDWDTHLETINDIHKPPMDQIGFQDLITEQMHFTETWWDDTNNVWVTHSAGKQPAWINYMTETNKVRGNFAINGNEMWMTLNRQYRVDNTGRIQDLTTYIDPVKFNNSFAQTSLDAQNFWVQIAVDCTARRKMSAKIMPNL